MFLLSRLAAAAALCCSPALAKAEEIAVPGALGGTLVPPAPYAATVVVVPARTPAAYDLLAAALQERGFGSLVLDASRPPSRKSAAVVATSIAALKNATTSPCIWLIGHGEGGDLALAAAGQASDLCGVILVNATGRTKNARSAAVLSLPLLIVSGGKDLKAGPDDGSALRAAQPDARHAVVLEMDHALRSTAADARGPALVSSKLVDILASFMLEKGPQVHGSLDPKQSRARGSRRAARDPGDAAAAKS